jgi:hypothetical protein
MSQPRVYEWHKRFREGREDVHDDESTVRPLTSTTDDNAEKIREIVRQDRRMSIRLIAEQLKIDKETVRIIFTAVGYEKGVRANGSVCPDRRSEAETRVSLQCKFGKKIVKPPTFWIQW